MKISIIRVPNHGNIFSSEKADECTKSSGSLDELEWELIIHALGMLSRELHIKFEYMEVHMKLMNKKQDKYI